MRFPARTMRRRANSKTAHRRLTKLCSQGKCQADERSDVKAVTS